MTTDGRYSNDQGVTVQSFNAPGCVPNPGLTDVFANSDVLTITNDVCLGTNGGESWATILPAADITSRTVVTPHRLAILNVNQSESAFLTLSDGANQVLMRSDDRGQTWQELLTVPGNAMMSGSGSRMGIVVPRDTTLYYRMVHVSQLWVLPLSPPLPPAHQKSRKLQSRDVYRTPTR